MRQLLILTILFITLSILDASAQGHVVRGKIVDETGLTVPGATVVEVDANDRIINGSITDIDGNYTLKFTSPNAVVKFSFIGYKTISEELNGRTVIDVQLELDSETIDEVVIRGSKISSSITGVSERDKTGSSVRIEMAEIKSAAVTSVGDALQGQIAGLDIMGGGSPGSGSSIVIRGLGSLGSSNPLIVVDGIVQKVSTSDIDLGSADTEDIGMLVSISPEDIKSVRVLKDAAETAIWGSQGANGVIEIETLTGTRGKTRFDFTYKKSLSIQAPTIPMLNGDEYIMLQQEMYHNKDGFVILPNEIANDPDYVDYYNYAQNTDWIGEITQIGEIDDINFKLSGGGDKTTFFASVGFQNNIGTVMNTANKRLTSRINLNYRISERLTLDTKISYVNIYKDDNWSYSKDLSDMEGGKENITIRRMAYIKSPNMAIYDHNSEGVKSDQYFNPLYSYQGDGSEYYNPYAVGMLSDNDRANNNFQTNFNLKFLVNDWLILRETVSFQYINTKNIKFLPYTALGARWLDGGNNWASEKNASGTLLTTRTTALLTPVKTDNHFLSGTFLWETNQNSDEWIQTSTGNGPSVYLTDPAAGAIKNRIDFDNSTRNNISSSSSSVNSVGALGQVLYKLKDKHIFNVNARLDANSKFGNTFRWGLFPSVSYAWRFSDETFVRDMGYVDDSKLRISYGRTGSSSVKAYDRHGIYSAAKGSGTYLNMPTLIPTQVELERLKWETSDMLNVGLDLSMFKERLNITAEYYDKKTSDMLWPKYKLPTSSGYAQLKQYNEGGLTNRGWELSLRVRAVKRKKLNITLNFNIFNNKNLFTSFPANLITERNTDLGNGNFPLKAVIGTPVGSFFGFRYLGVYPTTEDAVAHNSDGSVKIDSYGKPIPMNYNGEYQFEGGDAIYQDVNYDGTIDLNDVVYLGDSNADYAGGFGVNVKYKGFSFNSQFLYRLGYQIVNEIAIETESMSDKRNQSTAVLRRWRRPGQDFPGMLPRAYRAHPANNLGSDRYVEDGDFFRLNNLTINYTFSQKVLKKLHLRKLKVGFNGRKLFTVTKYTGQDPEVKTKMTNPFWIGTDNGMVPSPKVYAINVEVGF
jgi:TonB-linked SusC/RagA family outer membrane protein